MTLSDDISITRNLSIVGLSWRSVVVSALYSINVVIRLWARLVRGWVTVCGQVNRLGVNYCVTSHLGRLSLLLPCVDGKMIISFRAE